MDGQAGVTGDGAHLQLMSITHRKVTVTVLSLRKAGARALLWRSAAVKKCGDGRRGA